MQPGAGARCELYRAGGTAVTGFGTPDDGVLPDGHIVAELGPCRRRIGADGGLVFAVRGDEHRALLEDPFEYLCVVHEHVACGAAHEHLDAANGARIGEQHVVEVAVGSPHVEAVVGGTDFCGPVVLLLEEFLGQRLRHGIGHLHEGGNAAGDGCPRLRGDLCLVGQSRFAEVDLIVDEAWQQVQSGAVMDLRLAGGIGDGRVWMLRQLLTNGCDAVAHHQQVRRFGAAFVNEGGAGKKMAHVGVWASAGRMSNRRICKTPMKASLKMFRLILEVPNSRSTKVMGTSAMRNPSRFALYFISI